MSIQWWKNVSIFLCWFGIKWEKQELLDDNDTGSEASADEEELLKWTEIEDAGLLVESSVDDDVIMPGSETFIGLGKILLFGRLDKQRRRILNHKQQTN